MSLHAFRRRLSARWLKPVDILCVGTSTTFGSGGGPTENGYTARLGQVLRGRLGHTGGGCHYLPTHPGWSRSAPLPGAGLDLGQASVSLGPGAWIERTVTCTGFRLHYRQGTWVAPTLTVTVDGTAHTVPVQAGVTTAHDGVWESGPLPRGAHTIRISGPTTKTSEIGGLYAYDGDEHTGIRTWCGGIPGATSAAFSDSAAGSWSHWRRGGALGPALLVLMLSSNDHATQTHPDTFEANVRKAIAIYRLAHPQPLAPVLLVQTYLRPGGGGTTHGWDDYGARLRAITRDTPNVDYCDVGQDWPATQATDVDDLIHPDNTHPTAAGHAWIADRIADHILGPVAMPITGPPPPITDLAAVPGLVSAWRASDLTGSDGSPVATWAPYAGDQTEPLTQAGTTRRPTVQTQQIGGRPAVRFRQPTGSTTGPFLSTAPWAAPVSETLTVAAVVRMAAVHGALWSGISATASHTLAPAGELSMMLAAGAAGNGAAVRIGAHGWVALIAVYNGAASRLWHSRWPVQQLNIPSHAAAGLTGLTVGAALGGLDTANADIAEIAVFRRALPDSEAQQVLQILTDRYGLAAS